MSYRDDLARIIEETVRPTAAAVDSEGAFPRASIDALADAGILALPVPKEIGGQGLGLDVTSDVVRQLSTACGSTAMVVAMHYCGTAALVAASAESTLKQIGARSHLTTLAFSEVGSRSHFWTPLGTAQALDDTTVCLNARKSWVTAAAEADSYVWSSTPVSASGPMSLWVVPADAVGLSIPARFDGMGLRGNDSAPVNAENVIIDSSTLLGTDGAGLELAMSAVLPVFLVLNASASVGLMQAVSEQTTAHLSSTHLQHLHQSLAQQLPARTKLARMQVETDRTRCLVQDAVSAIGQERADASLLVLEVKAAADHSAAEVADLAMSACGGAAFRKEVGIERRFRDSRAARVMAPTTDALLDFVGRALCGLPLFDAPAGS